MLVIGLTIWLCFTRIDTLFPYIRLLTSRNPYSTIHVAGIGFKDRLLFYLITSIISTAFISLTPAPAIPLLHTTGSRTLQIYFWHRSFLIIFEELHVYELIERFTGSLAATVIYLIIAVGLVLLCSLPVFSFPTKQILGIAKKQ